MSLVVLTWKFGVCLVQQFKAAAMPAAAPSKVGFPPPLCVIFVSAEKVKLQALQVERQDTPTGPSVSDGDPVKSSRAYVSHWHQGENPVMVW